MLHFCCLFFGLPMCFHFLRMVELMVLLLLSLSLIFRLHFLFCFVSNSCVLVWSCFLSSSIFFFIHSVAVLPSVYGSDTSACLCLLLFTVFSVRFSIVRVADFRFPSLFFFRVFFIAVVGSVLPMLVSYSRSSSGSAGSEFALLLCVRESVVWELLPFFSFFAVCSQEWLNLLGYLYLYPWYLM